MNRHEAQAMFRSLKNPGVVVLIAVLFAAPQLAAAEDFCKDILEYAARNYLNHYSNEQKEAWVHSKKCSTSGNVAGLDLFIDAVNIGASSTRNSQSCSNDQRVSKYQSTIQLIESTVSVPALQNWSSCMDAHDKKLGVKVRRPNDATIHFILTNGTSYAEKLTDVLIQSYEKEGITCSFKEKDKPQDLYPGKEFLVSCIRSHVGVSRGGIGYEILPGGSITIVTSLNSYSYGFPESFKVDNIPRPQAIVVPLSGFHFGTRAYYQNGKKSRLYECPGRQPLPSNLELVVISTREQRVYALGDRRGMCGRPPHCDGAGEYCAEVFYRKACYINREWHEWYKADSERRGIPYTKEAVCGIE
jgi:hypothetical protein